MLHLKSSFQLDEFNPIDRIGACAIYKNVDHPSTNIGQIDR